MNIASTIQQCINCHLGPMLITSGLVLDAAGAVLPASVLFVGNEEARKRVATKWNGNQFALNALRRDSRRSKGGAALLVLGFAFQIAGVWW